MTLFQKIKYHIKGNFKISGDINEDMIIHGIALKLDKKGPRRNYNFMILDSTNNIAEKTLKEDGVDFKVRSSWISKNSPFVLKILKIKRKSLKTFCICLEDEIKNKMILLGYNDYEEIVSTQLKRMIENMRSKQ